MTKAETILQKFNESSYKVGDMCKVDWDGPTTAKVIKTDKDGISLRRVDKNGKELSGDDNLIVVTAKEFKEMSI